jgi:hypothetical protein
MNEKRKTKKCNMTEVFELDPKSKSFNMAESACCIAFPETERIGLSSPFGKILVHAQDPRRFSS